MDEDYDAPKAAAPPRNSAPILKQYNQQPRAGGAPSGGGGRADRK
jgi:hypothetical protein